MAPLKRTQRKLYSSEHPSIAWLLLLPFLFFTGFATESSYQEDQGERTHIKVEVDGLACPFCAYGLEKKLKKVEGQKDLYIDIQDGYATFNVPSDKKPSKETLKGMVQEAGFKPRKIRFSQDPFEDAGKKKE